MIRPRSLRFGFILLCLSTSVAAQTPIDPSRGINWSQVGIPGGVPTRTTICATLSAGATATQINAAIASCPSGQVVYLNAGTYNLTTGLTFSNKSNVTLRGAGANQTNLVFSGSNICIGEASDVCFQSGDANWRGGPSNAASWTGSGPWPKGTTQITLSSIANLRVGNPLILDQLDDLTDGGTIYVCAEGITFSPTQNPPCSDDGTTGHDGGGARGANTANPRSQEQIVTVTAISGNTVTFSPGLYMPNWRLSQAPGAWWATSPIFSDGVENLAMDHTASDAVSGVMILNCSGCWVKGVKDVNSNRSHVWLWTSSRAVIRDSYFYGTKNSTSESYGVEAYPSSDTLIENNIFQQIVAPQMMSAACSGCVISYNYSIDDYYSGSANWLSQSAYMHAGGIDNLLLEENVGAGLYADLFHGTHHFVSAFRNRYDGFENNGPNVTSSHTNPMLLWPFSRYFNLVGNVLGSTALPASIYQFTPASKGDEDLAIYVLGTGTVTCCLTGDSLVATTLMRWGNYDTVTGAAQWNASEVPSGLSLYANPLPTTQTLPASLYLSAKPAWWPASIPWPAIGPDVTGGNIAGVAGHAYMIPAQVCYSTVMGGPASGTGNPLSFNAATCYQSTATPPSAPTDLKITP